jgi:hypothetical protein
VAVLSVEHCLLDVRRVHLHLVVARPQSSLVKYMAPWSSSSSSSTTGIGNLSFDVLSFNPR